MLLLLGGWGEATPAAPEAAGLAYLEEVRTYGLALDEVVVYAARLDEVLTYGTQLSEER